LPGGRFKEKAENDESGKLKEIEDVESENGRIKGDLNERTKEFALNVISLYSQLPKGIREAQVIGDQLLRSGTSVPRAGVFSHAARVLAGSRATGTPRANGPEDVISMFREFSKRGSDDRNENDKRVWPDYWRRTRD
jgi:hypothetical protein